MNTRSTKCFCLTSNIRLKTFSCFLHGIKISQEVCAKPVAFNLGLFGLFLGVARTINNCTKSKIIKKDIRLSRKKRLLYTV